VSQTDERLERLLSEELGECCAEDVTRRLDELSTLESRALPDDLGDDIATLGALSDPTRYRIARLLATTDGELCVCELTPLIEVGHSAISHALSDLREASLIERRKDGRWRYYRATGRLEAVFDALDRTRPDGRTGGGDD
jgi:DNA-binding transcriptional ArsR family regulator